jgi:methionine synthase I (cobalamin-dependent)
VSEPSAFVRACQARPLVLDGGMGTRLIARGLDLRREDPSAWNLDRPEEVEIIHRADRAAGADVILTNTFGANRHHLARYGLEGRVERINRQAVSIARSRAGPGGFVLGDLGYSPSARAIADQAAILMDCGVDALILETYTSRNLAEAVEAVDAPSGFPIIVSVYSWERGERRLASRLMDRGVSAIGVNCRPVEEATSLLEAIREDLPEEGCPLLVKPSASDDDEPGRTPGVFAAFVPRWLALGARLIGGCCGTTEAHVGAIRSAIDAALAGPIL